MDGAELIDSVRAEKETALSRLGSSKSLYAATRGEMDEPSVRAALATDARAAREVLRSWSNDETSADAADLFADAADDAADHRADVASDATDLPEASAMYDALGDYESTVPRLGGFVGWTLVLGKTLDQMVGFFVGNADPMAADDFRSVRSDLEAQRETAVDLLDRLCDTDADWEAAEAAATDVVEAAYEEYVTTLESMGVEPKNVC